MRIKGKVKGYKCKKNFNKKRSPDKFKQYLDHLPITDFYELIGCLNNNERKLIILRHMNKISWPKIMSELATINIIYSERHIMRIYATAIKKLKEKVGFTDDKLP